MLIRVLLICLGLLIATQTRVHAYTDPGSGTLILQMLLAAAFGAMFYLRRMIRWVRSLRPGRHDETSTDAFAGNLEKDSESVNGQVH